MADSILVQIPFSGALKQSVADEYIDPSQGVVSVINQVYTKDGKLSKRLGIAALNNQAAPGSVLAAPTTGVTATSWSRSALTLISQGGIYTYDKGNNATVGVANFPTVYPLRRPIPSKPGSFGTPIAVDFPVGSSTRRLILSSQTVAAGTANTYSIYITVIDADTEDIYVEPTTFYTGGATQIPLPFAAFYQPTAPAGAQVFLFFNDGNGNIKGMTFNPATNALSSIQTIYNASGLGAAGDIVPFVGDAAGGFVAFFPTSTTNLRIQYFTNLTTVARTVDQTITGTLQLGMYAFATSGASEHGWFAYQTSSAGTSTFKLYQTSGDGLFTIQVAPATIFSGPTSPFPFLAGVTRIDQTHCFVQVVIPQTSGTGPASNAFQMTGVSVTATTFVENAFWVSAVGLYPAGRPFTLNGVVYQPNYLNLYSQSSPAPANPQSQQYILYLTAYYTSSNPAVSGPSTNIATVAPRQINLGSTLAAFVFASGQLPYHYASSLTATRYTQSVATATPDIASSTGAVTTRWITDFFFDTAHLQTLFQANELGSDLHISGAVPAICDSVVAFEDNFFYYPEFPQAVMTGAVGSGKYGYAVIYAYVDAAGLIHRSAPAFVTADTSLGTTKNLKILPYQGSWRSLTVPGNVFAEIYRTILNGSTYYFVDRVQISGFSNSTTSLTWPASGGDTATDAVIQQASVLYTTGNVLDNVNPPAALMQISHQNRIAIVDETLRNVWFTKKFIAGEAPGFNEALIVPFPEGGNITGLGSMDDKFCVFKQTSIYVQTGEGPSQTGVNSDWIVQRVASDVGVSVGNQKSVVLMPLGLMFKSDNGIQLLARDLSVQNIGRPVQDTTNAYPNVLAATLIPPQHQVRFVCQNATGTASIVLVYDYLFDRWSTHTYSQLSAPVAGACLSIPTQQYSLITSDGKIWQERLSTGINANLDQDSSGTNHYVARSISTGWFKLSGVQGYQRARRILLYGSQVTPCTLTMSLAINYDPTVVQTSTWNQLPTKVPVDVQMHVGARANKQKSIQITLSDGPYGATLPDSGEGFDFVSLGVELKPIGTYYRPVSIQGKA